MQLVCVCSGLRARALGAVQGFGFEITLCLGKAPLLLLALFASSLFRRDVGRRSVLLLFEEDTDSPLRICGLHTCTNASM